MSEHFALHPLGWGQAAQSHSEHPRGPGAQLLQDKRGPQLPAPSHLGLWEPPATRSTVTHRLLLQPARLFASSLATCQPELCMSPRYTPWGLSKATAGPACLSPRAREWGVRAWEGFLRRERRGREGRGRRDWTDTSRGWPGHSTPASRCLWVLQQDGSQEVRAVSTRGRNRARVSLRPPAPSPGGVQRARAQTLGLCCDAWLMQGPAPLCASVSPSGQTRSGSQPF